MVRVCQTRAPFIKSSIRAICGLSVPLRVPRTPVLAPYPDTTKEPIDLELDIDKISLRNIRFSYNYVPTSYSNSAKGSFSVPNVGAHVWIFFAGGDRMQRLYRPIFLQWCIMIHLYNEKHRFANSSMRADAETQSVEEISHRALCNAFKQNDGSLAAELIRKHFMLPR